MPLFSTDTTDFRQVVPVTLNFTMEAILPFLGTIEADLLPRFLGDGVTTQLLDLADGTPPAPTTPEGKAFRLVRTVVGCLGFVQYLPFAEVQIEDAGVSVASVEGRKPAFEYQTKRLERQCSDSGWKALDDLIKLVAAHDDVFTGWADSPYYAEHSEALFSSATEFSRYYPINDRWLTFWAMRPFIRAVEEDRGAEALIRLDAELDETDQPYAKIKRALLRALAYESVLMALPHLSVELNGANVQVNYASQYSNINYYQPPGREHLDWVGGNLQKQCDLAWGVFETGLAALNPPPPTDVDDDEGYFIGGDKFVMI